MRPTTRDDPRWRQDGTAPVVMPRHGYVLVHGQTGVQRATTLALLRQERRRVEELGLKSGALRAQDN